MIWTTLDFGNHEGLTLPQLLFKDPDYFFWMMENPDGFKRSLKLRAQALDLRRKATSIRIPGDGDGDGDGDEELLEIEHMIHYPSRKYAGFIVVPESKPSHQGLVRASVKTTST